MCNMASVESANYLKAAIQTSSGIQYFEVESRLFDKAHSAIYCGSLDKARGLDKERIVF
ncbi:hypothetical protein F6453_3871 [Marinobacter nauticus]|uniref:Uncharacterized protein n=1 Tax=Marinobacter nauticus TaxID=2743 RepID=A0A833JMB1_MARNT|nr:hypothetical protein F6453_3871 [Marinobacter nauticus]